MKGHAALTLFTGILSHSIDPPCKKSNYIEFAVLERSTLNTMVDSSTSVHPLSIPAKVPNV